MDPRPAVALAADEAAGAGVDLDAERARAAKRHQLAVLAATTDMEAELAELYRQPRDPDVVGDNADLMRVLQDRADAAFKDVLRFERREHLRRRLTLWRRGR